MRKYYIGLILLTVLLSGCASKRFMKKGAEFESVGYYDKAAEMYYISLSHNMNNVESAIGLRKNGQIKLDNMLNNFRDSYNDDLVKDAVYKYRECTGYLKKVNSVGINLSFPNQYRDYYSEVKDIYLENLYQEAYLLLDEQSFEGAENKFNEILIIDPNYGDATELRRTAHYEPIYRKGKNQLSQMKYRSAYYSFNEILQGVTAFKDTKELLDEALSNALITVAITDFTNLTRYNNAEKSLQSGIENKLTASPSPFIKVVDRNNEQQITSEQLLTLEGVVDETISSKAGKKLGVKALLSGELIELDMSRGNLVKSKKFGYIKEKITEEKNGEKKEKTTYHKTTYYEFTQSSSVTCSFRFKLVSTETSEVLVSGLVTYTNTDKIHYAVYSGNSKKLVQGYWSSYKKDLPDDYIKDKPQYNRELQNLLKARKQIKDVDGLKNESFNYVTKNVVSKIEKYDPEK